MAFLNKLLMQSLARAIQNRDPQEVAARQANSPNRYAQAVGRYERGEKATKGKSNPSPTYGGGGFGFLRNIPAITKAIRESSVDRNRGPNAGFGGAGMAGGMGTKGMPSGGSAPSFAEIIQSRGGFPIFGGSKKDFMPAPEQSTAPRPEMTGVDMVQLGNMRFPMPQFSPQQPTAPDMDQSFLMRLVQAGIYPDLKTAMRGEAERRQATMQGIAQLMPKIAGSIFGGR